MDGKITFPNVKELALFLKTFEGSTAKFEVKAIEFGEYVLTFTGGF